MTERWRPIPGYEGRYAVSDRGRVMSFQRGRGRTSGEILWTARDRNKRVVVGLWLGRKRRQVNVSTLVALAFIGPRPEGMDVCHNDGNLENNTVANLRYDTHQNNCRDRIGHGTQFRPAPKLTDEQKAEVRRLAAAGIYQRVIGERFGVSQTTIWRTLSERNHHAQSKSEA